MASVELPARSIPGQAHAPLILCFLSSRQPCHHGQGPAGMAAGRHRRANDQAHTMTCHTIFNVPPFQLPVSSLRRNAMVRLCTVLTLNGIGVLVCDWQRILLAHSGFALLAYGCLVTLQASSSSSLSAKSLRADLAISCRHELVHLVHFVDRTPFRVLQQLIRHAIYPVRQYRQSFSIHTTTSWCGMPYTKS